MLRLLLMFLYGLSVVLALFFGSLYQQMRAPVRVEKVIEIKRMPSDEAIKACERICLPSMGISMDQQLIYAPMVNLIRTPRGILARPITGE